MNYRQLLKHLQKLPESDLDKMVTVFDYESETILEDATPSFEFGPDDTPYITIN